MRKDIKDILERIASGNYDQQDEEIAKRWLFNLKNMKIEQISEAELEQISEQMWKELAPEKIAPVPRFPLWSRIASIAAVILVVGIVGYYVYQYQQPITPPEIQTATLETILPGGNRAYITTESGEVIALSTDQSGLVIGDNIKYFDGSVVEGIEIATKSINKLTMIVPKAGVYQVQLADGSKILLNSGSKLTYPRSFVGERRIVELEGEAYFQVKEDRRKPFIVNVNGQSVEVLGTQFNIHSYDANQIVTTLEEGAVKVISDKMQQLIRPGEQTINTNGELTVHQADMEQVLAWKDGNFVFTGSSIQNVMQQLENWYDIEVIYEGPPVGGLFYANISRSKELLEVLKILEKTQGVHFKMEGRKVVVRK